jgi:hypothetical protein
MLRHLNSTWTDKTVQLYVDDGAIFASGVTTQSALRTAAQGLEEATAWLAHQGLRTDADKAEAMVFLPPRPNLSLLGTTPTHVAYRDPIAGQINIRISHRVRYLGLFLDPKLSWKPHIRGVQSCTYFLLIGLLIGLLICHLLDKENFKESDKDENDQDRPLFLFGHLLALPYRATYSEIQTQIISKSDHR